jgi:hypothetical protein
MQRIKTITGLHKYESADKRKFSAGENSGCKDESR